mmetsp:Transcript_1143/g.3223  ORF Transcript_1143/g.3223 Transcript_1143/m.3223 type:complete len:202 (+) Transcript_1143:272-877(+)
MVACWRSLLPAPHTPTLAPALPSPQSCTPANTVHRTRSCQWSRVTSRMLTAWRQPWLVRVRLCYCHAIYPRHHHCSRLTFTCCRLTSVHSEIDSPTGVQAPQVPSSQPVAKATGVLTAWTTRSMGATSAGSSAVCMHIPLSCSCHAPMHDGAQSEWHATYATGPAPQACSPDTDMHTGWACLMLDAAVLSTVEFFVSLASP